MVTVPSHIEGVACTEFLQATPSSLSEDDLQT